MRIRRHSPCRYFAADDRRVAAPRLGHGREIPLSWCEQMGGDSVDAAPRLHLSRDSVASVKSRLIVNPVSGTDAASSHLTLINERLRAHVGTMDIVMTIAEGDAARDRKSVV